MNTIQDIPSISSQVITYLTKNKKRKTKWGNGWISGGELENIVIKHNGSTTRRICRLMAESEIIQKDYFKAVEKLRPIVFYKISK